MSIVKKVSKESRRLSAVELKKQLRKVRLFLCDVDGILTDTSLFVGGAGEVKRFHIQDGLGLRLLQMSGIPVGWISHRMSPATTERANELKVDFLHQDKTSKVEAAMRIMKKQDLGWDEVCFMGDDIVDLGAIRRAGLAVTVPHAVSEIRRLAHYTTQREGGHGAVREVVEMILKAQNLWDDILAQYDR